MKRIILFYFLCFCQHGVNGQNDIVIGKIDTVDSDILSEQRKVWVHVPDDYAGGEFSNQKYPVVYLLDGDGHFYSVVGMIRQLSSVNGNTICPKMIVVGIPNTNRTRDLTPTKGKPEPPLVDSTMAANSGGGENFISFIEKELIPYVDSNYPTEPYRMFIGHSLGGLTVINTLIEKPDLFNSYVAIDPSMWWNNKTLLNKIKNTTFDEKYSSKSLFLGIANTMSEGMDTTSVQKDTTISTKHIRALFELNSFLNQGTKGPLSFKGKYYDEDDHGSVPLIAEYDALRFVFGFYRLKIDLEEVLNPESDILGKVETHYNRLSNEFGREIKPEEGLINNWGYSFMSIQQLDRAEQFFKLNVRNYPESFNVYDSLGDLYAAKGEKEKAIENYKKSLSINSDSMSKAKLEELEKE